MTNIAIRVENCILSGGRQPGVEGLSKLYTIGRAQQRHDTLRDAMSNVGSRMSNLFRRRHSTFQIRDSTFQIRDSTFQIRHLLKILSRITEPTRRSVWGLWERGACNVAAMYTHRRK